jgi:hypothetical protein
MNEIRRRQSSASVDVTVDIQNPSIELPPISSSTNPQQTTDQPFAIDSATWSVHLSPGSLAVDRHDEPLQGFPTSSSPATFDHFVPEGRLVQLINSDQIPRYTKDIKMQVGYTILSLHPYISLNLCRPYVATIFHLKPLTTAFP